MYVLKAKLKYLLMRQHDIQSAICHRPDETWKSIVVGESHRADELFDIIPVLSFSTRPAGAVPTNWKRSLVPGGTEPTVNSSPESERRTTKTRLTTARRLLVLTLTDPTGRQILATQSTRTNVNEHGSRDMISMTDNAVFACKFHHQTINVICVQMYK